MSEDPNSDQRWIGDAVFVKVNFEVLLDPTNISEPPDECQRQQYRLCRLELLDSMILSISQIRRIGENRQSGINQPNRISKQLDQLRELAQRVILERNSLEQERLESTTDQSFHGQSILALWLKMMLAARLSTDKIEEVTGIIRFPGKKIKGLSLSGKGSTRYHPGLPNCILASFGSHTIISASQDRFGVEELDEWSRQLRDQYLRKLEEMCPSDSQDKIRKLRDFSESLYQENQDPKNEQITMDGTEKGEGGLRYDLAGPHGILGTWNTRGEYMKSCRLDHCRFKTRRPEKNQGVSSRFYPAAACAEWSCFVEEVYRKQGRDIILYETEERELKILKHNS
ncbi:hypothetical protein F5Y10DRAFT_288613 [Nemania abortiva]|nr:hypothetical protein F5Y10DRAFT_288613 [Nemania abortiva]